MGQTYRILTDNPFEDGSPAWKPTGTGRPARHRKSDPDASRGSTFEPPGSPCQPRAMHLLLRNICP